MSKWRPSKLNCLYVIPDIHGADVLLENALKRILPLRKSDGGKDKIIFLGDYFDRGKDGHKVLDRLIGLKKKYGDKVICICGNHELMLLESLGFIDCASPSAMYDMWMDNGGRNTLAGYCERAGIRDAGDLSAGRAKDIIPKEHIEFLMNSLDGSYQEEEFVFVHGGCNPDDSPANYDIQSLAWDRSLFRFVMALIKQNEPIPWENKVVICGHNTNGTGLPVIKDKYMMLDCGAPERLLVVEARSREAFMSLPNKTRLVKFELKETVMAKSKGKPSFRRVQ